MEPTDLTQPISLHTATALAGQLRSPSMPMPPKDVGEVAQLAERANAAVTNLEQEFEMLVNRLQNVMRQEAPVSSAPINEQPAAAPRHTALGGQLDSVVYRTDKVADAIRTVRELLEN